MGQGLPHEGRGRLSGENKGGSYWSVSYENNWRQRGYGPRICGGHEGIQGPGLVQAFTCAVLVLRPLQRARALHDVRRPSRSYTCVQTGKIGVWQRNQRQTYFGARRDGQKESGSTYLLAPTRAPGAEQPRRSASVLPGRSAFDRSPPSAGDTGFKLNERVRTSGVHPPSDPAAAFTPSWTLRSRFSPPPELAPSLGSLEPTLTARVARFLCAIRDAVCCRFALLVARHTFVSPCSQDRFTALLYTHGQRFEILFGHFSVP